MDSSLRLWESLRTDVRQADQVLDQQLGELEDLANISEDTVQVGGGPSASSSSPSPAVRTPLNGSIPGTGPRASLKRSLADVQRRFDELQSSIDGNLRHYESQVHAMTEASAGSLTATKHTERFQGLLLEKRRTLQRIVKDFRRRREQLELLPSIAVDLRNYEDAAGVRLLMDEQSAIRHTHARVNNILEQAAGTQARLQSQRERFAGMGDRLVQIAERIPVIQSVLRRIDSRRRRDVVILGSIMSIFMFLIVIFW